MPYYCYSTDTEIVERFFRMGEAPASILLDCGCVAHRDFSAEHRPRRAGAGWPMECIASGVNAAQAGELREFFAKSGIPTEVSADGNPIYRSPEHRRKALKLRGFVDRSSYC